MDPPKAQRRRLSPRTISSDTVATPVNALPPPISFVYPLTGSTPTDELPPSAVKNPLMIPAKVDRLSLLSAELHALILAELSPPGGNRNQKELVNYSLVSKAIYPHVREWLYRDIHVDSRLRAHSLHRTLQTSASNSPGRIVRKLTADVGECSKTGSQWLGWFIFHSMHNLCGILKSCRSLLSLTLYLPRDATAWTMSLCMALTGLSDLRELNKDICPRYNNRREEMTVIGQDNGLEVGWESAINFSMWSVGEFVTALSTMEKLETLRICGLSSDSSILDVKHHTLNLREVVLVEINITNTDLVTILGDVKMLEKLVIWRSSLLSKRGLCHALRGCLALKELVVGGSWFGAKGEDDGVFPLDSILPYLPDLRVLKISGSLMSPEVLLNGSCTLDHLAVSACAPFSPDAIMQALVKCSTNPLPVKTLSLPDMALGTDHVPREPSYSCSERWDGKWVFTVKRAAEAKGIKLDYGTASETWFAP